MIIWHNITGWMKGYEPIIGWLGAASILMFIGTLITVPFVIVKLPRDFFKREHRLAHTWPRHLSIPFYILKNGLGIILVLIGLVMLVLPGQGLLTLFAGLILLNFPRKRILIRRIMGQKRILRTINHLRARFGKPDLELP